MIYRRLLTEYGTRDYCTNLNAAVFQVIFFLSFQISLLIGSNELLNGKNSERRRISAGVPHGSVLGPLFFLAYFNDLLEDINSDVKLFADDTSLFSVVEKWPEVPMRLIGI